MPKKRITIVIIIMFLLSLIFLYRAFPMALSSLFKQDQAKYLQKAAGNDEKKIGTSSSFQNNNLPTQKNKIIIDPGHGGIDSGVDKGHIVESKVTLDISKKLKTYLEEKSFVVDMTRASDTQLYKLSNITGTLQRRELDVRANIIDKSGAKIFVSIHVNSYPQHPEMSGSIVYYNPLVPQSKILSEYIQKQLNGISGQISKRDSHKPQQADFYLLKNTTIPGVLVETAFITNSIDYKLLSQDNFKSQIAQAVGDGIEKYIN